MGKAPKPKPRPGTTRRDAVEAMRRQQRKSERKRTVLMVGVAVVVGLGIVAAAAVPSIVKAANDPAKKSVSAFGVSAAQAGCDTPVSKSAVGAGQHVDPGTVVKYAEAPPAFGTHDGAYITDPRHFYTPRDRPPVEKLVHSLEHGYTVIWYDATVTGKALEDLQGLAVRMPEDKNPGRWFLVAPWTADDAATRGAFPADKHVVLTHWGQSQGTWQYCTKVSGEAVATFVKDHPYTDAPEPGGV